MSGVSRALVVVVHACMLAGAADSPADTAERKAAQPVDATAVQEGNGAGAGEPASKRVHPSSAVSSGVPIYVRPNGAPGGREGGGTRNVGGARVLALLPEDHAALTAQVQPTLYWYLPEATDASIVVQIWGDDGDEPLFERRSEGGALAGFHAVPLEDTSVRLESGRDYRWYVVGIANRERPQEYTFSGGTVRRVALPAGVEPDEARSDTASELARKGLWCDALHLAFIEDEGKARGVQPGSRVWALLQQVGITAHLEGAVSLEVR